MMNYAERLRDMANVQDGSLLDTAVMTQDTLDGWRLDTANTCNNGHSSTKLFTSVAIGMLWDEGKLDLKESAAALFRECWPVGMDRKWQDVTIENVLRHLIGFEQAEIDFEGEEVCGGGDDCLKLVFAIPLLHPQGTYYRYSDAAYYLLSRIVEAKSGMTLETFIRQRMGIPMGFRDFAIASCPLGHTLGGGCMYARATDMVKLGFMLAGKGVYKGKRLLSEEYIRLMMEKGYGLNRFRDHEIYLKTGAFGQCIAFSLNPMVAAAWHRRAYVEKPQSDRNDMLLECFRQLINETE
jgi:CubicO group peptidase (beta-lactamase class C family)